MRRIRWCLFGSAILVGLAPYGGRPATASASDDWTYEGPAVVFETPTGVLVFSPGEVVQPLTIGFDLGWDMEAILKGLGTREVELLYLSGSLIIEYDPETGVLEIWSADKDGEVLEARYAANDPSEFLEAADELFQYLRCEIELEDWGVVETGSATRGAPAPACAGGSCTGFHNGVICCTACCAAGFTPFCGGGTDCSCGCTKVKTAKGLLKLVV